MLQDLGVDSLQVGASLLPNRQQPVRIIPVQRFLAIIPGGLACGEGFVIDPPTQFKLLLQPPSLSLREPETVVIGFHTCFWCSIDGWTTSRVIAPTVETNVLRVQRVGNRFLSQENAFPENTPDR
jgi:hypothetical protein